MPGRTCRSASTPAFIDLGVSRWQQLQLVGSDVTELTLSAFSRNLDVLGVDALRAALRSSHVRTGPAGNLGPALRGEISFAPSFESDRSVREIPPSHAGWMAQIGDRVDGMEQALVGCHQGNGKTFGFGFRTVGWE